jgi:hypothetical protein
MKKTKWKIYQRKGSVLATPWVRGMDMTGISVNKYDKPRKGGMIARDPDNPKEQWYINKPYFDSHYEVD